MGFFENYRQRRAELTGAESADTLTYMLDYLQDGANWTQQMYENANGARCLVAAANHVRVSPIDDAKHWLRLAIAEVAPGVARIEDFNDTRSTFAEVAAVIERARQLALAAQARQPVPVAEILPPRRAARPAPVFLDMPRAQPARVRRSLTDWIMD
ncbi:MAG: hypothetical protein AB7F35_16580 [Acetobacteraceae bacterium]